jgi:hypothetical protein
MALGIIFSKGKEKKASKGRFFLQASGGTNPFHRAPQNSSKKLIKIDSGEVESFVSLPQSPWKSFRKGRKKPRKASFLQASGGTNPPTEP